MKYTVLLQKQGTGVIAYETAARKETDAVRYVMDAFFRQFPKSKVKLFGISKTDGKTTVSTTRYLGKL